MPTQRSTLAAIGLAMAALLFAGCTHSRQSARMVPARPAGVAFQGVEPQVQSLAPDPQGPPATLDAAPTPSGRTVTATATGRAEGSPDLLTVSVGVQTEARSAQAALADNNTKAQTLIAKLKSDGVADRDIQTAELRVNPQYASGSGAPFITGYQVTNLVTAKLRKLDRAGSLIDDAVAAAGDAARVNAISYSIDDDSALLLAARSDAVRQAAGRAKAMAQAAGASLGPVRAIVDATTPRIQPLYGVAQGMAPRVAGGAPGVASAPVETGTQVLTVQVAVIYDLA